MSKASICPFCAVGCGLLVEEGEPLPRFRGDPHHAVNHGAVCARGAAATFEAASRERLLAPLRRAPGAQAWTPVSWDEVLTRAAAALVETRTRTFDPARAAAPGLAFFGGATAMNEEAYLFARLARLLGALDVDHQGRSCHAATTAGLGATLGPPAATHDWSDLLHARWILILGSNPADAHPIAARVLHGARARGARVVVADPRRSRTAQTADRHLALRPGTDLALLCGLIAQVLARGREDRAWLDRHTDAGCLVADEAGLDPVAGRFGGWNSATRGYETDGWRYQSQGTLDHPGSVLQAMRRHFSRYTPEVVAAITGLTTDEVRDLADRVCACDQHGAILFSMGVTQQVSGVAVVRAAAILQALLGNLDGPGGGLFPMKGHANVQGATDLGGLFSHLPGYLPAPTTNEATLDAYGARHGPAPAGHLARLLRAWMADGETAYSRLPRRRDGDHHSLHACLSQGHAEVVVLLGQNPVRGSGNPRAVEHALRRVRVLVCIDPFLTETSTFWEQAHDCATEVLALPSAMFAEKPGSRTNACRRVQWQDAAMPIRGDARPDAWIVHALYKRVAPQLPHARWPFDDSSVDALYRAIHAEVGEACWLYDGLPTVEGSSSRETTKELVNRGPRREMSGWHWPGGSPRLRDGLPRRVRLWAGPCDIDGWRHEAVPDGPLPEYYVAPGTDGNPLHPAQAANPMLDTAPTAGYPLVLSTAMSEGDLRRCAPGQVLRGLLEVRAPRPLAERLGLADSTRVWLETAGRRAPAVLRLVEGSDHGVVWAPSHWSDSAEDAEFQAIVDPGDRHTLLDDLRLVPCRLVPRR